MLINNQEGTIAFSSILIICLSALLLGVGISLVYRYIYKNENYSVSYTVTLIFLPAIIAMIILLVGSNVARAFSLAGAFSLVRFRSAPGDAKDIAYVFLTVSVGLACGMGYIAHAALFAVIILIAAIVLRMSKFDSEKPAGMRLKIVLPEDMNYDGVFDEVLDHYTTTHKLTSVKTKEFGSLFEVSYEVFLKNESDTKLFIDELRCKNGNLNVCLGMAETDGKWKL